MRLRTPLSLCAPLFFLLACGDDPAPSAAPPTQAVPQPKPTQPAQPPAQPAPTCVEEDIQASLEKVEGIGDLEKVSCGAYVQGNATCFKFTFSQKLDHANESDTGVFKQHGQLIHRGCGASMTVVDNGYNLPKLLYEMEPSLLFATNTLELEHRFQGASLPEVQSRRWSTLSIENSAADMHAVITAFKKVYPQKWVSTGASKGGITAVYHRFLYPSDVDGTVGYVAPASQDREDFRYQDRLESSVFPAACVAKLRAFQVGALSTRRDAFALALSEAYQTSGVVSDYYLESLIAHFDWGFWQGEGSCDGVPEPDASEQVHIAYFKNYLTNGASPFVPPATKEELSGAALSYEWAWQQGYAQQVGRHLNMSGLFKTPAVQNAKQSAYFEGTVPTERLPAYDGSVTKSARDWVKASAEKLVLIYGERDPWSGGALDAPSQASSGRYFAPGASHGASIVDLSAQEQQAAQAKVAAMYGKAMKVQGKGAPQDAELQARVRVSREAIVRHEAVALRSLR